jgi:hypothetical protein
MKSALAGPMAPFTGIRTTGAGVAAALAVTAANTHPR